MHAFWGCCLVLYSADVCVYCRVCSEHLCRCMSALAADACTSTCITVCCTSSLFLHLRIHPSARPFLRPGMAAGGVTMESLAMSEASIKRSHVGASGREDAAEVVVHAAIINSVDTAQLNKVRLAGSCDC